MFLALVLAAQSATPLERLAVRTAPIALVRVGQVHVLTPQGPRVSDAEVARTTPSISA